MDRYLLSPRRVARMDGCDAQTFGGPSDVEADDIAFANQIDSRHRAANSCAGYRHEWKLKRDLLAAMRPNHAAATSAVELQNHPLVEISRKALAIEIVTHDLGSSIPKHRGTVGGKKPAMNASAPAQIAYRLA